MFKMHMTPLTAGGQRTVHQGKGSQMARMPNRGQIAGLSQGNSSFNDYTKATPMAGPQTQPPAPKPVLSGPQTQPGSMMGKPGLGM